MKGFLFAVTTAIGGQFVQFDCSVEEQDRRELWALVDEIGQEHDSSNEEGSEGEERGSRESWRREIEATGIEVPSRSAFEGRSRGAYEAALARAYDEAVGFSEAMSDGAPTHRRMGAEDSEVE